MPIALHLVEIVLLVWILCTTPQPTGLSRKAEKLLRKIEKQANALANIVER